MWSLVADRMRRVKEDRCDYRSMPAVLTELAAEFNSTVSLVPNLSQPYPKLIPALSQFCIRPVPALSQPYPSPIPALSQSCSSPIPTLSQPCADSVPAETSSKSHTNLCLFQLEAINIKRRINLPLSERVHPKCQLVYLKSRVVTVTCSTCRHSVSVPIVPDTVPEMVGLTSYRRPSTRHGSHSNLVVRFHLQKIVASGRHVVGVANISRLRTPALVICVARCPARRGQSVRAWPTAVHPWSVTLSRVVKASGREDAVMGPRAYLAPLLATYFLLASVMRGKTSWLVQSHQGQLALELERLNTKKVYPHLHAWRGKTCTPDQDSILDIISSSLVYCEDSNLDRTATEVDWY
uniref:Uncharacterized protein n=1 Tax=Timema cristinae TaxID=61476 RepID=A0A7R9CWJ6_TIMCR|nr:unnamed protein product [Timema cristinae]